MATTGTVSATQLNFRMTPDGTVIKKLPKGTSVEILKDQGEWLKVKVGAEIGFVSDAFIQRQGEPTPAGSTSSGTGKFHFSGKTAVAPDGTELRSCQ